MLSMIKYLSWLLDKSRSQKQKDLMHTCIVVVRKELPLNQKNRGAAIEKPLFVDRGCLEMVLVASVIFVYKY